MMSQSDFPLRFLRFLSFVFVVVLTTPHHDAAAEDDVDGGSFITVPLAALPQGHSRSNWC
jgi:hypothetical protein